MHEIIFERPIKEGYDGLPIGNGDLAAVVWTPNKFKCVVNKSDIWTLDEPVDRSEKLGNAEGPISCCELEINTEPAFTSDSTFFEARLNLYNGISNIKSENADFSVNVQSFIDSSCNLLIVNYHDKCNKKIRRTIKISRWINFLYGRDISTGTDGKYAWLIYKSYKEFFYAVMVGVKGVNYEIKLGKKDIEIIPKSKESISFRLFLSVVTTDEVSNPLERAKGIIIKSLGEDGNAVRIRHQKYWENFWKLSYIETSQTYVDTLWYFYFYQLASCSRGKYPVKFNGGLWTWNKDKREWGKNYVCHNETSVFLPIYSANHIELGAAFFKWIGNILPTVKKETKERFKIDGAWYCEGIDRRGISFKNFHPDMYYILSSGMRYSLMLWDRYRYTLDEKFLKDVAYPVMKECCKFYQNYVKKGKDGKYHISPTLSWEERPVGSDATTDIAAIKVGFKSLIEASKILGVDEDKRGKWKEIIDNIADYPCWNGMFSSIIKKDGKPKEVTSLQWMIPNLANVFPFGDVGLNSKYYKKAVETFRRFKYNQDAGHEMLPVIAARLGLKEDIKIVLKNHITYFQWYKQGHFNYMHRIQSQEENRIPYLEPAGIFATSVNEMLLQSYDGIIRVFPAFPDDWKARFKLLASGNLLIYSKIDKGNVEYIIIENLGFQIKECKFITPWKDNVYVKDLNSDKWIEKKGKIISINTKPRHRYYITNKKRNFQINKIINIKYKKKKTSPMLFGNALLGDFKENRMHSSETPLW